MVKGVFGVYIQLVFGTIEIFPCALVNYHGPEPPSIPLPSRPPQALPWSPPIFPDPAIKGLMSGIWMEGTFRTLSSPRTSVHSD